MICIFLKTILKNGKVRLILSNIESNPNWVIWVWWYLVSLNSSAQNEHLFSCRSKDKVLQLLQTTTKNFKSENLRKISYCNNFPFSKDNEAQNMSQIKWINWWRLVIAKGWYTGNRFKEKKKMKKPSEFFFRFSSFSKLFISGVLLNQNYR